MQYAMGVEIIVVTVWATLSMCAWAIRFANGAGMIMRRSLLAGWFIYGLALLIPALIHAIARQPTIEERRAALAFAGLDACVHCIETVCRSASVCPHCGRDPAFGAAVCFE